MGADGSDRVLRRDYTLAEMLEYLSHADLAALVAAYQDEYKAMHYAMAKMADRCAQYFAENERLNREIARLRERMEDK